MPQGKDLCASNRIHLLQNMTEDQGLWVPAKLRYLQLWDTQLEKAAPLVLPKPVLVLSKTILAWHSCITPLLETAVVFWTVILLAIHSRETMSQGTIKTEKEKIQMKNLMNYKMDTKLNFCHGPEQILRGKLRAFTINGLT